jgi:electron transport complex protein RnfG
MRDILKPALVLLAICAGVTLVLALVFQGTKPIIAQRAADDLAAAKKEVLPSADQFADTVLPAGFATDDPLKTVKALYIGTKTGIYEGIVVSALSRGYDASGVVLTVGIDKNGTITGIHVGDQKETPGLGTKVLDKNEAYLPQYKNLKPDGDLTLVKNKAPNDAVEKIDAVTGATITSRAVWRAVQGALEVSRKFTPEGALK